MGRSNFPIPVSLFFTGSPRTVSLPGSQGNQGRFSSADIVYRRYINFANAAPDELEQLTKACEPASFGVKQENVLDETYRKAGKMDSECFALTFDPFETELIKIVRGYLLEGPESERGIKAELYKLNIYGKYSSLFHLYLVLRCCLGKGSFFKPHVDTPRSEKMFGSLVVVFPTPHEGGALSLRHHGHEWVFDSAKELAAVDQPTIGYVAFFSDIEHEVAPVTSGHRITLTYSLYFEDGSGSDLPVSEKDASSKHLIPPKIPNQEGFSEAFKALLEDPEFMANGGTLAFGLRHVYPIKESLKHVYDVLKGSDAVVYDGMRALEFDPVLYVYYEEKKYSKLVPQGAMINKLVDFSRISFDEETALDILQGEGGIPVRQDGGKKTRTDEYGGIRDPELVEWVTPRTTYNRQKDAYVAHGNEETLAWAYGDVCMIVRIGKAGDRLAFPTAAQVKSEYLKKWERFRY